MNVERLKNIRAGYEDMVIRETVYETFTKNLAMRDMESNDFRLCKLRCDVSNARGISLSESIAFEIRLEDLHNGIGAY